MHQVKQVNKYNHKIVYLIQNYFCFLVAWIQILLGTAFAKIPEEYQWKLALICPLAREIFVRILLEVSFRAAGPMHHNSYEVTFPGTHYMESRQAIFYCITLASVSPLTSLVIIASDFVINIFHGVKIIYKYRKTMAEHNNQENDINMTENEGIIEL